MSTVHTSQVVSVQDAQRSLEGELGPRLRVSVASDSVLKVSHPGVIPSRVVVSHVDGGTTFSVRTTGLILSRLMQATTVNPQVHRALKAVYGDR